MIIIVSAFSYSHLLSLSAKTSLFLSIDICISNFLEQDCEKIIINSEI